MSYVPPRPGEEHAGWRPHYPARWVREDGRWAVYAATNWRVFPRVPSWWALRSDGVWLEGSYPSAAEAIEAVGDVDYEAPLGQQDLFATLAARLAEEVPG